MSRTTTTAAPAPLLPPSLLEPGRDEIAVEVIPRNLVDEIEKRFRQLDAAMTLTWGNEENEGINGMADDLRDVYLWGMHTQIRDLKRLFDCYAEAMKRKISAAHYAGGEKP